MASCQKNLEEVLKALQAQNEILLQLVREATSSSSNPTITGPARERASTRTNTDLLGTPELRPISSPALSSSEFGSPGTARQVRRRTLEAPEGTLTDPKHTPASLRSSGSGRSQDHIEDEVHFLPLLEPTTSQQQQQQQQQHQRTTTEPKGAVTKLLDAVRYEDRDLLGYLFNTEFCEGVSVAMQEFLTKRAGTNVDWAQSFRHFAAYENEGYQNSSCEIYDIGLDGLAQKAWGAEQAAKADLDGCMSEEDESCAGPEVTDAASVWAAIKDVNYPSAQAVGRITIIQEPTALMFGALHLAMSRYFDMDELLSHLVTSAGNGGKTTAYMNRAFLPEPPKPVQAPFPAHDPTTAAASAAPTFRHPTFGPDPYLCQRSFFFVFKYYSVVGPDHTPAPWENFDNRPPDKRSRDHIDIAECSSVLALSLCGAPTSTRTRRRRGKPAREGYVFDTFAPWVLLNVQSFPDDEHTDRGGDAGKVVGCGPWAFLDALVVEFQDAAKRNRILHEKITKLVTPDINFMFEGKIRDKLLFEDKHFTYIRRYFWAYMSLGVINTGIKSMLTAYDDTFTPAFWCGAHPTLWPHPAPDSAQGREYLARLAVLRAELDRVLAELWAVYVKNEGTRREIQSLREQLFSGSSIMESRRAIEQGDNIRILTLSSMVFLPLTFVTSVFGITEFTIPATDWRFPVTMVCVCVPFIILLILLQTRSVNNAVRSAADRVRMRASGLREGIRARWRGEGERGDGGASGRRKSVRNLPVVGDGGGGGGCGLPPFPRGPLGKGEERRLWLWFRGGRQDDGEKV